MATDKHPKVFRDYAAAARPTVKEFYRLNHRHQTLDFVLAEEAGVPRSRAARDGRLGAMEFLNTLVDDSDPDTDLTQIEHVLQTAEAIRRDGQPRWFILTGLIHDLGKMLCLYGEPQWAVVGDTFPVGCAFSEKIVYPGVFRRQPGPAQSRSIRPTCGIYERTAVSPTSTCRGGTTSTCTRW